MAGAGSGRRFTIRLGIWTWVAACVLALTVGLWQFQQHLPPRHAIGGASEAGEPSICRQKLLFAGVALVAGVLLFFVFLQVLDYGPNAWYYLPLMALVAVCVEALLSPLFRQPLRRLRLRLLRLALIALYVALVFSPMRTVMSIRQTNLDLIAAKLETLACKDDLIVVSPFWIGTSFHRYYKGTARWMSVPPLDDLTIQRFDLLRAKMASPAPLRPLLQSIGETLKAGHRVWLVGELSFLSPGARPPALPPAPREGQTYYQPYLDAWRAQAGFYVQTHAENLKDVKVETGQRVNLLESPSLQVVWGWQRQKEKTENDAPKHL